VETIPRLGTSERPVAGRASGGTRTNCGSSDSKIAYPMAVIQRNQNRPLVARAEESRRAPKSYASGPKSMGERYARKARNYYLAALIQCPSPQINGIRVDPFPRHVNQRFGRVSNCSPAVQVER